MGFFRKPFKIFAIDADTGKPLDPNVRRKKYVKYYDIKPNGSGSKLFVAHKANSDKEKKVKITTEDVRRDKGGNGEGNENHKNGGEEGKKQGGGGDGQQQHKGTEEAWTTDEDEQLKAMKAEHKPWADISAEIGRVQWQCKARFKEIGQAAGGNNGQKNKQKEGGGNKGKRGGGGEQNQDQNANNQQGESKKGKKNQGGDENIQNAQKQQADKAAESKKNKKNKPASTHGSKAPSETLFTMHDWQTLQEDDLFSFGELQCLSELIAKDSEQSWERIAARFFDLTGRRVHWEDVRDKFEGMAWATYKASK